MEEKLNLEGSGYEISANTINLEGEEHLLGLQITDSLGQEVLGYSPFGHEALIKSTVPYNGAMYNYDGNLGEAIRSGRFSVNILDTGNNPFSQAIGESIKELQKSLGDDIEETERLVRENVSAFINQMREAGIMREGEELLAELLVSPERMEQLRVATGNRLSDDELAFFIGKVLEEIEGPGEYYRVNYEFDNDKITITTLVRSHGEYINDRKTIIYFDEKGRVKYKEALKMEKGEKLVDSFEIYEYQELEDGRVSSTKYLYRGIYDTPIKGLVCDYIVYEEFRPGTDEKPQHITYNLRGKGDTNTGFVSKAESVIQHFGEPKTLFKIQSVHRYAYKDRAEFREFLKRTQRYLLAPLYLDKATVDGILDGSTEFQEVVNLYPAEAEGKRVLFFNDYVRELKEAGERRDAKAMYSMLSNLLHGKLIVVKSLTKFFLTEESISELNYIEQAVAVAGVEFLLLLETFAISRNQMQTLFRSLLKLRDSNFEEYIKLAKTHVNEVEGLNDVIELFERYLNRDDNGSLFEKNTFQRIRKLLGVESSF